MPDRPSSRIHHRGAAGDWPGQPAEETRSGSFIDETAIEQLSAQLEAAKALAAEHLTSLQRTAADFANFKRRTAEDRERELGLASEMLLRKLLAVVDDFDRALDAMPPELKGVGWIEGIVLLDRKLRALLESEGVTPIEAVGRPFDPREHEAIANVPATGRPDGEVVAEIQRGYRVRDRVLRPAMVAVADGGAADGGAAGGDTTSHTN
jgi:molecular chaperone GrpE